MAIHLVFLLVLLSRAAGLDPSVLNLGVRRTNEADKSCPDYRQTVERLLYNIDIGVEGISKGCVDNDLLKIGEILQKVVDDVEQKIPDYKNESMETNVCPLPIAGLATRRGLRLDKANRELQTARGRYIYRGGGKCQRCRRSNNDRRFLQSVEATCLNTDSAVFGADLADLADTAVEAVDETFFDLKEIALECPNLRSGKTLVIWAMEILNECEAANERAQDAVETARDQCEQAKLPSAEAEHQSRMRQVSEAFDTAVSEVEKARNFHFEMQEKLANIDVCNQPIKAPADNLLSLEGQSAVADMATFAVEMSATAVEKANEVFSELAERVMKCGDSIAGAQAIIDRATETLIASEQAEAQATRKARKSRSRSGQAQGAKSKEKLIQTARMAEQFSTDAFLQAERARYSYFNIRDELERLVCIETPAKAPEPGETPLKLWLVEFMKMLYDRIPVALSTFPSSETCKLGGIGIYIHIDALERPEEEIRLVTKDVCDILGRLPK